jgi:hypothetical protein
MARVYFGPYAAIKYVGRKKKLLATSRARPKPELRFGDIVIVEKKTAFNNVKKGFGEFEYVDKIEFVKADRESAEKIEALQQRVDELEAEKESLLKSLEQTMLQVEAGDSEESQPEETETEANETYGEMKSANPDDDGALADSEEAEGEAQEDKEPEPETPEANEQEQGN